MKLSLVILAMVACVSADIYLHNMRGSNNRLDEARRDRNNANRLFDSQNNNRGGNNVGKMYFYEGEEIPLEWTNQHGCGNDYNDCQLVFQYMCGENLRDGVTTRTIPRTPAQCLNNDCNRDVRFGMHEDYDYYINCRYRKRNRGLFTADRNLNGNTARFTRQNNNGQRRGYECPEERDHYPYWHPTPWVDLAILTDNAGARCPYYKAESENVKGRNFCKIPDSWYHHKVATGGNGNNGFIPNTETTCVALNTPNSEMVNFLKNEAQTNHAETIAQTNAEFNTCKNALAACGELDPEVNAAAHAKCTADFQARSITKAALDAAHPVCGFGPDGVTVTHVAHPMSDCKCVVAGCDDPSLWVAASDEEDETLVNGCPAGFERDPDASETCVATQCLAGRIEVPNAAATDAARAAAMQMTLGGQQVTKYLLNTEGQCVKRHTLTADCALENLPQAEWALHAPHKEQLPWLEAPVCTEGPWSRPNHLGNGMGGFANMWNMTFPPDYRKHCALRLRYNITTTDYNGLDPHNSSEVNSSLNRRGNGQPAKVDIRAAHGIAMKNSDHPYENERGYLFEQNPTVQIFDAYINKLYCKSPAHVVAGDPTKCKGETNGQPDDNKPLTAASSTFCPMSHPDLTPEHGTDVDCTDGTTTVDTENDDDFELRLAINTNQFGRTFQDRTHAYDGKERDESLKEKCDEIYAVNGRGKRGNIVQTFPGVEYDFVPNRLHVREGSCIHFQWTGSNTNPNNNDGQGKQGTDRHNIAIMEYVRGEGGRGVEDFGGKGKDGTTWTTAGMEPGWEGWNYDASPTMADMQCPPVENLAFSKVHPANWKMCAHHSCEWKKRACTTTTSDNGETTLNCADCPAGYSTDPESQEFCVNIGCSTVDRPANPATWTGVCADPRDGAAECPSTQIAVLDSLKRGSLGMSHPEHMDNVTAMGFLGLDYSQMVNLAILNNVQYGGEMSELDDAGTYFDLPVHKVTGLGTYNYMCTRNNNFSNRSQKGKIVVEEAKETSQRIGENGGAVGMSFGEVFSRRPQTEDQIVQSMDFAVQVPSNTLAAAQDIAMKVFASESNPIGMAGAASPMLWLGPDFWSQSLFPLSQMTPVGSRNRRDDSTDPWVQISVVNASHVWYNVQGDLPASSYTVHLHDEDREINHYDHPTPNNQGQLEGMIRLASCEETRKTEKGEMLMSVYQCDTSPCCTEESCSGAEFQSNLPKDENSGKEIMVKMPVSVSVNYGKVYHWPETAAVRSCLLDNVNQTSNCNQYREEVEGANVGSGKAEFAVGTSACSSAGGFYQVSSGNNVALIVGVTIACVVIALVAVGSAVYFRKHPKRWDGAKKWGPAKYKKLQRSFASQV